MIDFFKELVDEGLFNGDNRLHVECSRYCFGYLIQHKLDEMREVWNTHYIRQSGHGTVAGRPDELYHGSPDKDQGYLVSEGDLNEMDTYVGEEDEDEQEYTEYFDYLVETLNIQVPSNWTDAKDNYILMLSCSF